MGIFAFYCLAFSFSFFVFDALKSELENALSNPLGHRNHKGSLSGGTILQMEKRIRICMLTCAHICAHVHIGVDHARACCQAEKP